MFSQLELTLLLLLIQVLALRPPGRFGKTAIDDPQFDWGSVSPSENLHWHNCYSGFYCARLLFPLDWQNVTNENKVAIAIIKSPAPALKSGKVYGGPVIINPGGPGGSGVQFLNSRHGQLQKIINGGKKKFDIVSFDPRGVAFSTPSAACFKDEISTELWDVRMHAKASLDSGPNVLTSFWSALGGRADLCARSDTGRLSNNDNIRRHMSTASVARDMLEMVDRMHTLSASSDSNEVLETAAQAHLSANQASQRVSPKIQYIGFSYGTVLGNFFASMFPDRVGKMVLDGNTDPIELTNGNGYTTILNDADAAFEFFFETCSKHPTACPLTGEMGNRAEDIKTRVMSLIERLGRYPTVATGEGDTDIITGADVKAGVFTGLYFPFVYFKELASQINALLNGTVLFKNPWNYQVRRPICQPEDQKENRYWWLDDVHTTVECSDGKDNSDADIEDYKRILERLQSQSTTFGAIAAKWEAACMQWPRNMRPAYRFDGPFSGKNSTRAPILFTNTRADPVCPIRNAYRMSERYDGSVVLELNTAGHCALLQPADCVKQYVWKYLADGELPQAGTVCQPDCEPFDESCERDVAAWTLFD